MPQIYNLILTRYENQTMTLKHSREIDDTYTLFHYHLEKCLRFQEQEIPEAGVFTWIFTYSDNPHTFEVLTFSKKP